MKVINLSGNNLEIGRQLASLYRQWGKQPTNSVVNRATLSRQLKIYRKHFPSFIKTMEYSTSGADFQASLYDSIASGIDRQRHGKTIKKGCTIFGVKTNEQCFVGRNYDWVPQARDCFHVYKVSPTGRYKFIGISDMGTYDQQHKSSKHWGGVCCEDYLNEKGLFIGLTFAHCDNVGFGLMPTHIMQLIAETCATVAEVTKLFKKVPVAIPKNFFVADSAGNMIVVEHNAKTFRIIKPDTSGVLIHTNHYLSPDLQRDDLALNQHPAHTSYLRYYETLHLIKKKPNFSLHDAVKILRKSSYVYGDTPHGFQTIWSLAMDVTNGQYDLYYDSASGPVERRISRIF